MNFVSVSNEDGIATHDFAGKELRAFSALKGLLRKPVAEEMVKREKDSIREFVDIWYLEETWENLKKIKIYS